MIIATGVTPSGIQYAIDDSCIAPHDTEQEKQVIEAQCRVAFEILESYANQQNSA